MRNQRNMFQRKDGDKASGKKKKKKNIMKQE